ncbi:MAG: hypothetical protein SFW09_11645 [Hyphomicrobiaceae bacterium]|nr:hypothetical protein [Hyphomicrobiaceae bacterium]
MKTLAIAAIALATLSTAAAAQSYGSNRIDRREANQERRIQEGLRSGDITRREYRQLEAEQRRIQEMERQAKRDGYIDRREAREIARSQDAASRHIAQERSDGERRGSGLWQRRWW